MSATYELSHLRTLESEAIHIIREVAAEFERPVLLFSGGKDSIVMFHLAVKAFTPARVPFPVMHVDTGHNFPEVLAFRDAMVEKVGRPPHRGERAGRHRRRHPGGGHRPRASRNRLQTTTLLRGIEEGEHDAVFGGARRDEEKARAKERVFSFRDDFGQWDPKNQRPELWNLYNGRHRKGEHIRVFPLSNWTELDIWQYIADEAIELPSIYYAHPRRVFPRDGMWMDDSPLIPGSTASRSRSAWCASAPSATSPAPARSTRPRHPRPGHRRGRRHPAHRARRHPRRRPDLRSRHGRPQEGGLLLSRVPRPRSRGGRCGIA